MDVDEEILQEEEEGVREEIADVEEGRVVREQKEARTQGSEEEEKEEEWEEVGGECWREKMSTHQGKGGRGHEEVEQGLEGEEEEGEKACGECDVVLESRDGSAPTVKERE